MWYVPDGFNYKSSVAFENQKMNLEIDVRWAADSNELVLELKPTVDDLNYNRIIGLLREFVPVESEQKAVFKKGMEKFDAGQIKELIEGFMGRIDEMASVV